VYLEPIALILIFSASLALLFVNFKAALYVLLFLSVLLHKELFSFYRWDVLPARIFMLAFFAFSVYSLFSYFVKHKSFKNVLEYIKDPFILTLLLVWVFQGVSIINTLNLQASILKWGFSTTVTALGIYLYVVLRNKPEEILKKYLKAYILILLGLSVFALVQLVLFLKLGWVYGALWNVPGHLPRLGAVFWDVNHFGGYLAGLLPLTGVLILTSAKLKEKAVYLLAFVPGCAVLLFTNSRTAWINAFVAFAVFSLLLFFRRMGYKGVLLLLTAFLLAAVPLVVEYNRQGSWLREEVKGFFHYRIDSFDSHFMLLEGTAQIFSTYPFIGGGYGSFFEHFSQMPVAEEFFSRDPAALTTRVPAHTIWGEVLAETGIIGMFAYLAFILVGLLPLLYLSVKGQSVREAFVASAMAGTIIGWLTGGIFYSYNTEFFWIIFFMFFIYGIGLAGQDVYDKTFKFFLNSKVLSVILITVISTFLLFFNLGKNHLLPWDEAIYANISKNMVLSGDYVVEHWWPDSVWYEKPPLAMWLMAGSFNLFGVNEFAARLPSALLGLGTVLLVYFWGTQMFNKTTGFIAGLSLITTFNFLYYSRTSMLDVISTFFITLALYTFWHYKENSKNWWNFVISAVATGLAVMTKGVTGFVPLAVIGFYQLYLLLTRQERLTVKMVLTYLGYVFLSALVFMPWHVLDRATSSIEGKGQPFFWYVVVMKVSMRIWFVALIPALVYLIKKVFKKSNKHVFLAIGFAFIFILFSSSVSKLKWYIMPIYPFASLIVAYFIERAYAFISKKFKFTDSAVLKALFVYLLLFVSLFYLYYGRGLVYEADQTGAQAELIQIKDSLLGSEHRFHADRIELPLLLFYSKSPFIQSDYTPIKTALSETDGSELTIFITKENRFEKLVEQFPGLDLVAQRGDWYLGVYSQAYDFSPERQALVPVQPCVIITVDGVEGTCDTPEPPVGNDRTGKPVNAVNE
jgi:hypothetical protein